MVHRRDANTNQWSFIFEYSTSKDKDTSFHNIQRYSTVLFNTDIFSYCISIPKIIAKSFFLIHDSDSETPKMSPGEIFFNLLRKKPLKFKWLTRNIY